MHLKYKKNYVSLKMIGGVAEGFPQTKIPPQKLEVGTQAPFPFVAFDKEFDRTVNSEGCEVYGHFK